MGYRQFAVSRARALGLVGYVINLRNGEVKVTAEGEPDAIDQFAEALRRGPSGAYVREVIASKLPATGEFHDFRIEYE